MLLRPRQITRKICAAPARIKGPAADGLSVAARRTPGFPMRKRGRAKAETSQAHRGYSLRVPGRILS